MALDNRAGTETLGNLESVVVFPIAGSDHTHRDTSGIKIGNVIVQHIDKVMIEEDDDVQNIWRNWEE